MSPWLQEDIKKPDNSCATEPDNSFVTYKVICLTLAIWSYFCHNKSTPRVLFGEFVETLEKIKKQIAENPILLYMKGNPKMPQCGFSARAVKCIDACGVQFAFVDVLANPDIRQALPQYADWPTFPQLYVKGELIGGSDIIIEMYEQGELESLLREAVTV